MYKIVCFPLTVPIGDHCWNFTKQEMCKHFNNYCGERKCTMGFNLPDYTEHGIKKPLDCLNLSDRI